MSCSSRSRELSWSHQLRNNDFQTVKVRATKGRMYVHHWEFLMPSVLVPASVSHHLNHKVMPACDGGQGEIISS